MLCCLGEEGAGYQHRGALEQRPLTPKAWYTANPISYELTTSSCWSDFVLLTNNPFVMHMVCPYSSQYMMLREIPCGKTPPSYD